MAVENQDTFPFVDRRKNQGPAPAGVERRQFSNSLNELSPGARELGLAIDRYKLENRRKYITYEEMYAIVLKLGYQKAESQAAETAPSVTTP